MGRLITTATGERYSHVAVSDITTGLTVECMAGKGVFIGQREKLLYNVRHAASFAVGGVDHAKIWWKALDLVGQGYNYSGAIRAWLEMPPPRRRPRQQKVWFCTEMIDYLFGLTPDRHPLTPDQLKRIVDWKYNTFQYLFERT